MKDQKGNPKQLFETLLRKMYEKGERETNISTKDIIHDIEIELRSIIAEK